MLFRQTLHAGIEDGTITLAFRRWSRPQARAGGRYRLHARGAVDVSAIKRVAVASISDADARRAGYAGAAPLVADLERYGGALRPEDDVYRIAFRYVPVDDPRTELASQDRLADGEIAALIERLARMDRTGADDPWTAATLALIADQPRVVAARLAAEMGRERLAFKQDVRKLKALGLTVSHDVGYELSPRGRALLTHLQRRRTA